MENLKQEEVETTPTSNQERIWQQLDEVRQALGQQYWPELQQKAKEVGFAEWDLLLTRRANISIKGVTAVYVHSFMPYMNPASIVQRLADCADRGFIQEIDAGVYVATSHGREAVKEVMGAALEVLATLAPLPDHKQQQLQSLLSRLSQAMATAVKPATKPTLQDACQFQPQATDPPYWHIVQSLTEIMSFRDDAHIAAWQPTQMPGYQWEAFSHIWGQEVWGDPVNTTTAVAEKLAFRGYDEDEYQAALQNCCQRGLLTNSDGCFEVTEQGHHLRQEAEITTDSLFFAPWSTLTVPEQKELSTLLDELLDTLPTQ